MKKTLKTSIKNIRTFSLLLGHDPDTDAADINLNVPQECAEQILDLMLQSALLAWLLLLSASWLVVILWLNVGLFPLPYFFSYRHHQNIYFWNFYVYTLFSTLCVAGLFLLRQEAQPMSHRDPADVATDYLEWRTAQILTNEIIEDLTIKF